MWTVGYQYKVSKQTQVLAYYNVLRNEHNGVYSFDSSLVPLSGHSSRLSALAVGLQIRF